MKAAKLGWAGPGAGQEQTMSRPGAGWEQARSRSGAGQEQAKSNARARKKQELSGSISCLYTKFHPNCTENIEIKKICYWSALIGRSSESEK